MIRNFTYVAMHWNAVYIYFHDSNEHALKFCQRKKKSKFIKKLEKSKK
jgi:hypothetical protein